MRHLLTATPDTRLLPRALDRLVAQLGTDEPAALLSTVIAGLWPYAGGQQIEVRSGRFAQQMTVADGGAELRSIAAQLRGTMVGEGDAPSRWAASISVCPPGGDRVVVAELDVADRQVLLRAWLPTLIADGLSETVERLMARPDAAPAELPPSHATALAAWNDTARPYPRGRTIVGLVAAHASARPDHVAVQQAAATLTYGELEALAGAGARALVAGGLQPGDVVVVALGREVALPWVLLAVLKAGGVYAVVDPDWPVDYLRGVLATCSAPTVIARRPLLDLAWQPPEALLAASAPVQIALPQRAGDDPCCVFFTSGTTAGRPRAVLVRHVGTVRAVVDAGYAVLDAGTTWLQAAALPWDGLTLELWGALLNGARCILSTELSITPRYLRRLVGEGVDTVWLTSSLFNLLVEEDPGAFVGLRQVLIGGERLSPQRVRAFLGRYPEIALTNGYGPAEATVFTTTHRITAADVDDGAEIPIGRCLPNTRIHLVRDAGTAAPTRVPIGAVGEICVAGDGLGLGYLGHDDDHRFTSLTVDGAEQRIYRTGDLGALRVDGELMFAGRLDREVKVRGHRVDLAGVEAVLCGHPHVLEAAVVAVDRGERELVAFVRVDATGVGGPELGRWLADRVPAHAVPARCCVRPDLPRTATGKLDRLALLQVAVAEEADRRRPVEALPQATNVDPVTAVAQELLGLPVADDDDLFALGATSLLATRLAARLWRSTGKDIGVGDVLRGRTPRRIARILDQRDEHTPGAVGELAPRDALSHAQQRFWFAEQLAPGARGNIVVSAHRFPTPPDVAALTPAVADVAARHGELRKTVDDAGAGCPDGCPDAGVLEVRRVSWATARTGDAHAIAALVDREAALPFDLARCAVRFTLLLLGDGSAVLVIAAHHIVMDGWSEIVLLRDLSAAYDARLAGRAPRWPTRPTDYRAFVADEAAWLAGPQADAERGWWRAELDGLPVLPLPLPPAAGAAGPRRAHLTLPAEPHASGGILRVARYVAALSYALQRGVGARERVGIGLVVSGRKDARYHDTVGVFVNVLCLAIDLTEDEPALRLDACAAAVQRALARDRLPLDEVVRGAGAARTARHPLFQALLVVQDFDAARLSLRGCRSERLVIPEPPDPFEVVVETWRAEPGLLHAVFDLAGGPMAPGVSADELGALWHQALGDVATVQPGSRSSAPGPREMASGRLLL